MEANAPRAEVTVYSPLFSPFRQPLQGANISIGRASDCTIPIKDRFLSRKHAEIVRDRGTWFVRDCGSVNGTLVNGVKIADPVPLRPGDRIALGDSEVVFHADDQPSQLIPIDSDSHATNLAIKIDSEERGTERAKVLNSLAVEFLADRPMSDLFEFILDRVVGLMKPWRCSDPTAPHSTMSSCAGRTRPTRPISSLAARFSRKWSADVRSCRSSTA